MIDRPTSVRPPSVVGQNPNLDFADYQEATTRELDPRQMLANLWRRRRLLFVIWAVFVACVTIFTLLTPKAYTVAVKLIAGSNSSSEDAAPASGTNLPILNALLAVSGQQSSTQIAELLQQEPVGQEVIKRLGLNISVAQLGSHIIVRPVSDTTIVTLSVNWRDPVTAASVANAYADVFVERERELVAGQADTAIGYLQKELPDAQERMRAAQETLTAYQEQTGIADLSTQTTEALTSQQDLETKLRQAQVDEQTDAAALEQIQAKLSSTPDTIEVGNTASGNPVAQQLQTQIATLTMQLNAARKEYTDNFPTVVSLRSQLAEAKRELQAEPATVTSAVSSGPNPVYQALDQQETTISGQLAAAQASSTELAQQLAAAQPRLASLPSVSRRMNDLERAAKSATDVYAAIEQRYQDAVITKTTALSDVSITQRASPDIYTKSPNVLLNLLLGTVVGLILAITGVFLSDFFDDRFRNEGDVRERLGLSVLASIPLVDGLAIKDSAWVRPLATEAFYQLVAALRYSSSSPPRTIAFTSPDQGDGKSTTALNTAISMGQMKARVLLIDADLRRPTLHTKLGVSNEAGLTDVLVGVTSFDNAIRPTEHIGLSLLSSGRPSPNPVGLLQSEAFERLVAAARDRFDFVIIDAPALRSIVDGVVLGVKAEGTVLVVSSTTSERRAVRTAIEKLRSVASINLLGVVLNRVRPDRNSADSYYLGSGQSVSLPAEARV
jgi:capsular exopolysaccharide synthesis family protein